jgi:hypothetical protein
MNSLFGLNVYIKLRHLEFDKPGNKERKPIYVIFIIIWIIFISILLKKWGNQIYEAPNKLDDGE